MGLNPEETFVIKPNSKQLPFPGAGNKYSVTNKNVMVTKSLIKLRESILGINSKAPHIKNIVVEDLFHFMLAKTMNDINISGFNKFKELANEIYRATSGLEHELREDLNLIILTHSEEVRDAVGMPQTKLKLTGKFTEEVTDLPSFFTYVFETKIDFSNEKPEYKFLTNLRSTADLAKTPLGIFDDMLIDNDMQKALETIEEFENRK